jgi:hypothetical protein
LDHFQPFILNGTSQLRNLRFRNLGAEFLFNLK